MLQQQADPAVGTIDVISFSSRSIYTRSSSSPAIRRFSSAVVRPESRQIIEVGVSPVRPRRPGSPIEKLGGRFAEFLTRI